MVSKGLSDLIVKIGEERVKSVKNILMNGNETFRKLLEDDQFSGELVLCEGSSVSGFIEMEKYYSGGCMELNDENVMDVLLMSVYYNDNEILNICVKYIKNHLNDEMMLRILDLCDLIKKEEVGKLIELSEKYLKENGYKYLKEERLLYSLRIDNLKMILESDSLIIEDDNWLLNVLIRWYKNESKENKELLSSPEEKKEFVEEFRGLIIESIHIENLKIDEIDDEILKELSKIKMNNYLKEMKSKKKYKYYKIKKIKDERVEETIMKYYQNESEENISEKDLEVLNNENIISILLKNESIKMRIIGLLIIIESGISGQLKREILLQLINEYKESKKKRVIKCFCLFANNKRCIDIIEGLCGKEILFHILNYNCYFSKVSNELIVKYIKECKLSLKEEKEMNEIIFDDELLKELKTKKITSFSYLHSEYSFPIYEEISIIPSFKGNRVEFSITPSLPCGMYIDKENGIIHGKSEKRKRKEYEITCKNIKNKKKFKILLEFDIKFTELNKTNGISISNNGKSITSTTEGSNHCYLNLRMESGIYHIKYQFHQNGSRKDYIMLGLSTNNTYSGNDIFSKSTICCYKAIDGKSQDITKYCHIGRIVNSNPNFNNHGEGSVYKIIVDMNKREFWISHNNSSPVLLVKDLPSPLYPFVYLKNVSISVDLLSISNQD